MTQPGPRAGTKLHRTLPILLSVLLAAGIVLFFRGGDSPVLARGPYLQSLTPTGVVIRWRGLDDSPMRLEVRRAGDTVFEAESEPGARNDHEVAVSGLEPHTFYEYEVLPSGTDRSAGGTVLTAPAGSGNLPIRIWVLGCSGANNGAVRRVRDAYLADAAGHKKTDLIIMLGDNAYWAGRDDEYQGAVFGVFGEVLDDTPLWPTLGNHGKGSINLRTLEGPYYDIFTLPENGEAGGVASSTEIYYSFDYGNVHFISLNAEMGDRSPGGDMVRWLEEDLEASDADWNIAFFHQPPYSMGGHDSDEEEKMIRMREVFVPVLEKYGVDLVLSAHSHVYERSYLLAGHYGDSSSLEPGMILDGGDGHPAGDGAYRKPRGKIPHSGTIYNVVGSSSKIENEEGVHPVMLIESEEFASLAIDVQGLELHARAITDRGEVLDAYTIVKEAE